MKSHTSEPTAPIIKAGSEVKPFPSTQEPPASQASEHESLKVLIEKNIKWSQVIYQQNRKIQRRLSWMTFGSYFRLFLILVPIILGAIFLPPLVSDFMNQYGSSSGGSAQNLRDYLEIFLPSRK